MLIRANFALAFIYDSYKKSRYIFSTPDYPRYSKSFENARNMVDTLCKRTFYKQIQVFAYLEEKRGIAFIIHLQCLGKFVVGILIVI